MLVGSFHVCVCVAMQSRQCGLPGRDHPIFFGTWRTQREGMFLQCNKTPFHSHDEPDGERSTAWHFEVMIVVAPLLCFLLCDHFVQFVDLKLHLFASPEEGFGMPCQACYMAQHVLDQA